MMKALFRIVSLLLDMWRSLKRMLLVVTGLQREVIWLTAKTDSANYQANIAKASDIIKRDGDDEQTRPPGHVQSHCAIQQYTDVTSSK